jgi:hypothetical protein
MFADFDCVGEHAFNAIEPHNQVTRSGRVGFYQQICPDLLVGSDRISLDDEASGWSSGFFWHRTKAYVDGIGEDVHPALQEDNVVGRSHRVAGRTLDSSPNLCANCRMVRSKQPMGMLILVV